MKCITDLCNRLFPSGSAGPIQTETRVELRATRSTQPRPTEQLTIATRPKADGAERFAMPLRQAQLPGLNVSSPLAVNTTRSDNLSPEKVPLATNRHVESDSEEIAQNPIDSNDKYSKFSSSEKVYAECIEYGANIRNLIDDHEISDPSLIFKLEEFAVALPRTAKMLKKGANVKKLASDLGIQSPKLIRELEQRQIQSFEGLRELLTAMGAYDLAFHLGIQDPESMNLLIKMDNPHTEELEKLRPPLSPSKQELITRIQTEGNITTPSVTIANLRNLAEHYSKKHGIEIIIGGNSSEIADSQSKFLEHTNSDAGYLEVAAKLMRIEKDALPPSNSSIHTHPQPIRDEILDIAGPLFKWGDEQQIKNGLEGEFVKAINSSVRLAPLFEEERHLIQELIPYTGLSFDELFPHISDTSRRARESGQPIGFMVPISDPIEGAGRGDDEQVREIGATHSESLILSPTGFVLEIAPFELPCTAAFRSRLASTLPIASTDIRSLTGIYLHPQSAIKGCGSLGISYIKEYLKPGNQLERFGLVIEGSEGRPHFLLPSPHVLRYGQSSAFIAVLRAMVESDAALAKVSHGSKTIYVPTLAGYAASSATITTPINGAAIEDINIFRKAWLKEFRLVMNKRAAMRVGEQVQYLRHLSHRHALRMTKPNDTGAVVTTATMPRAATLSHNDASLGKGLPSATESSRSRTAPGLTSLASDRSLKVGRRSS